MLRRVCPNGEALVWCRICSGCALCRLEPQLTKHCRPEKKDTKENGKMLKRILKLEEGRVPDRSANGWRVEGNKKKTHRKRVQEAHGGI